MLLAGLAGLRCLSLFYFACGTTEVVPLHESSRVRFVLAVLFPTLKETRRAEWFWPGLAGLLCLNLFSGFCGTTEVVPFPQTLTGRKFPIPLSRQSARADYPPSVLSEHFRPLR